MYETPETKGKVDSELAGLCGCLRDFWSLASLGCGTLNSTAAGLHQESADGGGDGWGGAV